MTQARRAKGLRGGGRRAWLLVVIPLLMLLAGLLIFRGLGEQAEQGGLSIPGVSTASCRPALRRPRPLSYAQGNYSDAEPESDIQLSTPTAKPNDAAASRALRACRAKVKAADEVLDAAKTGMGHWSEHVQAQTDANSGEITIGEMEDIFQRTMKAGDEDEKRYARR